MSSLGSFGAAKLEPLAQSFARDGYHGPFELFTPADSRRIAAYLRQPDHPPPLDWHKGRAVHERLLFELAIHPTLMASLTALLGPNIVLWGVSAVNRAPGQIHPWHCDIESSDPAGGFVTVWIGIENTCRDSALHFISRSHRIGKTVQEARAERAIQRDLTTPDAMLSAVRQCEPDAELVIPSMTDGDALLLDGRLWHGSDNRRLRGRRTALLFQYAVSDRPVRIPDLSQLDWPFRYRLAPRPPTILISGTDHSSANRLLPAPPPNLSGRAMISSAIHPLVLPLENPANPWEPVPVFRGPTRTLTAMSCHASVLVPEHSPHPPHAHREEELLIPLHGEVEIRIARSPDDPAPRVERLNPGSSVYYPAWQHHTIYNPGTRPAAYLMFKWYSPNSASKDPLPTTVVHHATFNAPDNAPPFWTQRLFQGPTGILGKLHSHLTVLAPGGGYQPHTDSYDVAIVTLSGTLETLGQTVEPNSVIYYAAGEPHGMHNPGVDPARYLVFEFHAPGVESLPPVKRFYHALPRMALQLGKRLARPLWHRLKKHLPRA